MYISDKLNLFQVIQSVDDTDLIENQLLVAGSFLPITVTNEENSTLLYGTFVENSKSSFQFDFQYQLNPDTRDEPFYYHAMLIDVFCQTLQGSEAANINLTKVQEIFRLKYLMPFLLEPDDLFQRNGKKDQGEQPKVEISPFYQDYDSIVEKDYSLILKKNPTAMGLLKPKIVEIIYLVFLSPMKISLDRIYKNNLLFVKFFQLEANRLKQCTNENLSQREIDYIFDHLLKFSSTYHEKIFRDDGMNSEMTQREEKVAFKEIYEFLQNNKNNFMGKLTRTQNKNMRNFCAAIKGDGKLKDKEELDQGFEKSFRKNSRNQDGNKVASKWDIFLRSFLDSSILEKVIFFFF